MRGVPGYMAIDRVAQAEAAPAGPSRYDRVVVMARATTPVPAVATGATGASRGMPSPAQPPAAFQQTMPEPMPQAFAPPAGDDGIVAAGPDRNDVEQFQQQGEPPMPDAPVASPYPNAYPGSPYVGAHRGAAGPYGGNPPRPPRPAWPAWAPRRPRRSSTTRTRRSTSSSAGCSSRGSSRRRSRPRCRRSARRSARRWARPAARRRRSRPRSRRRRACWRSRASRRCRRPRRRRPRASSSTPTTSRPTGCRRRRRRTAGTPVEPDRAKYSNPYNPAQPPE